MQTVYVYVMDTMADWELSHCISELNSGRFFKKGAARLSVKTVALDKKPIRTMGGMTVIPDLTINEMDDSVAALLLPGADTWADASHQKIVEKAKVLLQQNILVGAMCGATSALAQVGIFDSRDHTSNDLGFLRMTAPNYKGENHYKTDKAVKANNLITASAAGSQLFARYVFEYLEVFSDETLQAWCDYFESGDPKHFFTLLKTLPREG